MVRADKHIMTVQCKQCWLRHSNQIILSTTCPNPKRPQTCDYHQERLLTTNAPVPRNKKTAGIFPQYFARNTYQTHNLEVISPFCQSSRGLVLSLLCDIKDLSTAGKDFCVSGCRSPAGLIIVLSGGPRKLLGLAGLLWLSEWVISSIGTIWEFDPDKLQDTIGVGHQLSLSVLHTQLKYQLSVLLSFENVC